MDDVLAAMPQVEREMVEADLESSSSRRKASSSAVSYLGQSKSKASGSSHPHHIAPSATPKSTPKQTTSHRPQPPLQHPLFVNATPALNQSSAFAPLISTNHIPTNHASPLRRNDGFNNVLSIPSSANIPTPPPKSLFASTGSANSNRNAFYLPPAALAHRNAPPPPTAPILEDEDTHMGDDGEDDYPVKKHTSRANGRGEASETEQLSYSVFGSTSAKAPPKRQAPPIARSETESKMPPGAYFPDDEEEVTHTRGQARQLSAAPPPAQSNAPRQTRNSRTASKSKKETGKKRRLPGALLSDHEEDHHEDEADESGDRLAPLPNSPPRKRAARGHGLTAQNVESLPSVRRSTRLSSAASVASASPEPQSPPTKTTRRTKTSKSAKTGGQRASTRKK